MPRPRTVADHTLLDAALELLYRRGPGALSFGALAAETGLASSTIVQRFGKKDALLRAALVHAWDRLDDATARAVAAAPLDAGGAVEILTGLTAHHDDDGFADHLLVLREDLRDPVLRARGAKWLATLADAVQRRLGDAAGDGLGELVVAHWQGLVIVWGFTRRAPLPVEVRRSLEALLTRLGVAVRGTDG